MENKTIHTLDLKDIRYLVLHRGLMLNDIELQYGEIYPAEMFLKVPQHTLIGMILGGWLYRGTTEDVERMKRAKLEGFNKFEESNIAQDKIMQIKEIKKMAKK